MRAIETIRSIRSRGARVVVLSHRGRPRGTERYGHNTELHKQDARLSLKVFVKIFEKAFQEKVVFISDVAQGVTTIQNSGANIFLCENLRFGRERKKTHAHSRDNCLVGRYVHQ
jgi:3-phosphoglycerate kinase